MPRAVTIQVPESLLTGKKTAVTPAVDSSMSQGNRGVTRLNIDERRTRKKEVVAVHEELIGIKLTMRLLQLSLNNGVSPRDIPEELLKEHIHQLILRIIYEVDVTTSDPWDPQGVIVTAQVDRIVSEYINSMQIWLAAK